LFLPKFDPAGKPLRYLDIDSECMPDAYLGGDFTTRRVTGIAWQFIGEDQMNVALLKRYEVVGRGKNRRVLDTDADFHIPMLVAFREAYNAADVVTGHNIIRHDLPIINGLSIYYGMGALPDKLASDTLSHAPRVGYVFSRSQEVFGDVQGVAADKFHMNNAMWKRANTLDPEQVALTEERVTSDVTMHIEFRASLVRDGLLDRPTMWSSGSSSVSAHLPH
jgi:hypothetical protein